MYRLWTEFIHVGIVHPMIFPECGRGEGPIIETAMKIIGDEFFGAIEVGFVKDRDTRKRLAKLLNEGNLEVVFCGGPLVLAQRLNLNSLDEQERKRSVEGVKQIIDMAYDVDAKICTILSGPMPSAEHKQKATSLLVDSLRELCDYAKSRGNLMLTLENFDVEYEKRCLIGPTSEAAAVAEKLRATFSNFGLTVDLSHLPLLHEKPEAVKKAGAYLEHVHVGNCIMRDRADPMYGDQHPRFGIANGENDVDELAAFLKALENMGYFVKKTVTSKPVVSFEVKPAPGESSEAVLAGSKRVFIEAWLKAL
ncbi:MAG: sugar phosphate isomerase/epimerase family protein [Candidatus Bathyarchaeia archaeon]